MASQPTSLPSKPQFSYREDVVGLLRAYVVGSQRFSDEFAARHRMHPTDLQAMAVLHQAQQEGVSLCAGELGKALSLSSPATSALLGRLEGQGHIARRNDEHDHRKVVIDLDPDSLDEVVGYFRPLGECVSAAAEPCGEAELSAIVAFLERLVSATNDLVVEPGSAARPSPSGRTIRDAG
jgi:DNA-binding MarR family transcriptional regulator